MSHVFDVLIVGGGIVGLTASLAMAKRGYSVALMDADRYNWIRSCLTYAFMPSTMPLNCYWKN